MKFYVRSTDDKDSQRVEPYSIRPHGSTLERAFEIHVFVTKAQYDVLVGRDLEVTIKPVQTREERLREARMTALRAANITTSDGSFYQGIAGRVLQIIERVDAEFAKENP